MRVFIHLLLSEGSKWCHLLIKAQTIILTFLFPIHKFFHLYLSLLSSILQITFQILQFSFLSLTNAQVKFEFLFWGFISLNNSCLFLCSIKYFHQLIFHFFLPFTSFSWLLQSEYQFFSLIITNYDFQVFQFYFSSQWVLHFFTRVLSDNLKPTVFLTHDFILRYVTTFKRLWQLKHIHIFILWDLLFFLIFLQ